MATEYAQTEVKRHLRDFGATKPSDSSGAGNVDVELRHQGRDHIPPAERDNPPSPTYRDLVPSER